MKSGEEVKDENQQQKALGGEKRETKREEMERVRKGKMLEFFHVLQCNFQKLFYILITILVFTTCV